MRERLELWLFLFCFLGVMVSSEAQSSLPTHRNFLDQSPHMRHLDPNEAEAALERFWNQRFNGDFSFNFVLRHLPRRGEGVDYQGMLWGSGSDRNVFRIQLMRGAGDALTLLLQGGRNPKAWKRKNPSGEIVPLNKVEWQTPLVPGLQYAPVHFLIPFIYWKDWEYEGNQRIKGRPARLFRFFPPKAGKAVPLPDRIQSVRIALDTQFNGPLKFQLLNEAGAEEKSLQILKVKKVQDQWIPKSIEVVDSRLHDKTRFEVMAAALNLNLPPELFTPEGLNQESPQLPAEAYEHFR